MSKKIKTYADLYEFAQNLGMTSGGLFPENVVIRVEVESYEYGQMLQDCHRAIYTDKVDARIIEAFNGRANFTIKFGSLKFIVLIGPPNYNFKIS